MTTLSSNALKTFIAVCLYHSLSVLSVPNLAVLCWDGSVHMPAAIAPAAVTAAAPAQVPEASEKKKHRKQTKGKLGNERSQKTGRAALAQLCPKTKQSSSTAHNMLRIKSCQQVKLCLL